MVRRKYGIASPLFGLVAMVMIVAWPPIVRRSAYSHGMAAVKAIATIHTTETQYLSKYGHYATSLAQLGPNGADLVDKDLASGHKAGVELVLRPTQAGYEVSAKPIGFASLGAHTYYYSDQNMIIHQHDGAGPATVSDPVHGTPGRI
jgi:hypothetical protein